MANPPLCAPRWRERAAIKAPAPYPPTGLPPTSARPEAWFGVAGGRWRHPLASRICSLDQEGPQRARRRVPWPKGSPRARRGTEAPSGPCRICSGEILYFNIQVVIPAIPGLPVGGDVDPAGAHLRPPTEHGGHSAGPVSRSSSGLLPSLSAESGRNGRRPSHDTDRPQVDS